MFEDIIGEIEKKTEENCIKTCLNCASYVEGVKLPGNTKTMELCRIKGLKFNGEICTDCKHWTRDWPPN
jgi:hypothetical protein